MIFSIKSVSFHMFACIVMDINKDNKIDISMSNVLSCIEYDVTKNELRIEFAICTLNGASSFYS